MGLQPDLDGRSRGPKCQRPEQQPRLRRGHAWGPRSAITVAKEFNHIFLEFVFWGDIAWGDGASAVGQPTPVPLRSASCPLGSQDQAESLVESQRSHHDLPGRGAQR